MGDSVTPIGTARCLTIEVRGAPAPQGSKRVFRTPTGRLNLIESSNKVRPWRDAVRAAVIDKGWKAPLEGSVDMSITFQLRRPSSLPKRVIFPIKKPDLDKLIRSTLDGLGEAGVWRDDSQVTWIEASKEYADIPGAHIEVWETTR